MEQSIVVEIDAPADRVWEVMVDVESWPEWADSVTRVERLGGGPLAVGSRARVSQPKLPTTEYVVTQLDPGHGFAWVATVPGVRTTAGHRVEALAEGRSRAVLSVAQDGLLGSVMGRFYRGLTDRYLASEAEGLKARSEGQR